MKLARQLKEDLRFVFHELPLESLLHVRSNVHRLVRGTYESPDGRKCIFGLATEILEPEQRICSRETLTRYWGGDATAPRYQPAKWIVRVWDNAICDQVRERYGDDACLTVDHLCGVLEEVLLERCGLSRPPSRAETSPSPEHTVSA